jgi:hypothetical protein
MQDARDLILAALERAPEITPAGASSLLAIAARALDPATPITRDGLARTLGLHPSLLIAALVSADLAGDTQSRGELGRRLFGSLELRGQPPELSLAGELSLCVYGLEQLAALEPLLDGQVADVLAHARAALEGRPAEPAALRAAEERAAGLQRTKVVPIERGVKTKLGIPPEEAARRRGAQALRAVLHALQEPTTGHLGSTVAGEVAACLCLQRGVDAAAAFVLGLAARLDALPPDQARRPASN